MNQLLVFIKTSVVLLIMIVFLRQYYTLYATLDQQPKPFMKKEEWRLAGAGGHVLPAPAQMAAHLIDSLKLTDYRPVGQITTHGDGYVIGTLNQAAWPARMDSTSRHIIGYYQDLITLKGFTIEHNYGGLCIGHY